MNNDGSRSDVPAAGGSLLRKDLSRGLRDAADPPSKLGQDRHFPRPRRACEDVEILSTHRGFYGAIS